MNWQDTKTALSGAHELSRPHATAAQRRRAFMVAAAVLLAALAGLYLFNSSRENAAKAGLAANKRPAITATIEIAQTAPLPQFVAAVGSLAAVHQVTISAEVPGQVTKIEFQGGAFVKKGEVLVQLNDSTEQADLASFQAQQQVARLALQRATELERRGNAAKAQLDQAQSQFDVASAGIKRAEAIIANKRIRAPFDGQLGVRLIEVGQYLAAGQPIVGLTDPSQLYLNISVPEQERPRLHLDQPVTLTVDAYPDRVFEAHVVVIDPQIEAGARTVKLQALVLNTDKALSAGMFANGRVMYAPKPGVLTLPETAVANSLYGDYVYLAGDEAMDDKGVKKFKAKRTPVTLGGAVDGRVTILSGVAEGDRIIVTGLSKMFDGADITPNKESNLVKPETVPRP